MFLWNEKEESVSEQQKREVELMLLLAPRSRRWSIIYPNNVVMGVKQMLFDIIIASHKFFFTHGLCAHTQAETNMSLVNLLQSTLLQM
jgi:hypothetical protein